ncbi:hypothetical protein EV192_12167 [Actinocrispum wychmicini]|uniref:Uncharacterized protein n=1 Tax=Actinocrispum wychmicini TaxID=1213861 RepID=A0A4R2IK16_9PSEU|nr:hypothetical protein EV192_12167 [Actinocrispum wychmicini]
MCHRYPPDMVAELTRRNTEPPADPPPDVDETKILEGSRR